VGTDPDNNLSDLPSLDRLGVAIDCWHQTDAGVETLAQAVRDAIEPHAHLIGTLADLREIETKLFRLVLQFDWFTARA
jgi:hypothetical protein